MSLRCVIVLAAIVTLLTAGCGGGGGSTASSPAIPVTGPVGSAPAAGGGGSGMRVLVVVPPAASKTSRSVGQKSVGQGAVGDTLTVHVENPDTLEDLVPPITVDGNPGSHFVQIPDVPANTPVEVRGTVHDASGVELSTAETRVNSSSSEAELTTGPPVPNLQGDWTSFGPAPQFDRFSVVNANVSGRTSSVLVDPTDPRAIFVGTATGGVWFTSDGGATWQCLTPNMENNAIGAMAFDPSDPTHRSIFVGTGEALFSGQPGSGIFRITANPISVTRVPGSEIFIGKTISRIFVRPDGTMYVGVYAVRTFGVLSDNNFGVFVRGPGQTAFTNSFAASLGQNGQATLPVADLDVRSGVNPGDADILYAAVDASTVLFKPAQSGIYRSVDGGANWKMLPLVDAEGNVLVNPSMTGRISVAVAPSRPDVVYALVGRTDASFAGAFVTADRGETWTAVTTNPDIPTLASYSSGSSLFGQSNYNTAIVVDPQDASTFYAAGTRPLRVSGVDPLSGNASSVSLASGDGGFVQDAVHPHVDHHGLFAYTVKTNGKNTTTLYDACDGGVWLLSDAASAVAETPWTNLNGATSFLETLQMYSLAVDPKDNTLLFCGTQDNGSGATFGSRRWSAVRGGDGGVTRYDAKKARGYVTVQYSTARAYRITQVTLKNGTFQARLTDGNGLVVGDPGQFIPPMILFPDDGRLALGTNRVYESMDGGDNWVQRSQVLGRGPLSAMAYHPTNPDIMYVGMANGGLFKTASAARPATFDNIYRANVPPQLPISAIAIDPSDAAGNTAYFAQSAYNPQATGKLPGQIFRTQDGGRTYVDFSQGLPNAPVFSLLLCSTVTPNILFAGNDRGVYARVLDGRSSWVPFGRGLPTVQVRSLELTSKKNNGTSMLAVGTFGRGAWQIPIVAEARALPPVDLTPAPVNGDSEDGEDKAPQASAALPPLAPAWLPEQEDPSSPADP